MHRNRLIAIGLIALSIAPVLADTPLGTAWTYQGLIKQSGLPANGSYDMSFTLWRTATSVTPADQVGPAMCVDNVGVTNGLFTVQLDSNVNPFDGNARWLQIAVRADSVIGNCVNGSFTTLSPRQELKATPYSQYAMRTAWSGIQGMPAGFADGIDNAGSLTLPFSGSYAGSDTSAFLLTQTGTGGVARFINTNAANYYEALYAGAVGTGPAFSAIQSGTGQAGQFQNTNVGNAQPALYASTAGSGACIYGNAGAGSNAIGVIGNGQGTGDGVRGNAAGSGNAIKGSTNGQTGRAGYFEVTNPFNNQNAVQIQTDGNGSSRALYALQTGDGDCAGFEINDATSNNFVVSASHAGIGTAVYGESDKGHGGWFQTLDTTANSSALEVQNYGRSYAGRFISYSSSTVQSLYASTSGTGGAARFSDTNASSAAAAVTITKSGPGLALSVGGTARVKVLEIEGGADFSEGFQVADTNAESGMVVIIDPQNPGRLRISTEPYDHKVAGIIAGAGGVNPGMLMNQAGTIVDGDHPVALTGRVYCLADATDFAIEPGDLLVTSSTPGHAMKANDPARSPGATLGKAMTALAKGEEGLVLVLVSLQ